MDLLFKRYASPFTLLDEVIKNGLFTDWFMQFYSSNQEEKLWDIWLHKDFSNSFSDFKNLAISNTNEPQIDNGQLDTIRNDTQDILNGFTGGEI